MVVLGILLDISNPSSNVDVWGHVGGIIMGFCSLPLLISPVEENDSACCRYVYWYWICMGIVVGFAIGGFLGFYLSK